jgi:hypothetical protein
VQWYINVLRVVKGKMLCLINCPTSSSRRVYGPQHTCLLSNRVAGYKSYFVKLSFPRLPMRSASPTTVLSTKRCHRGGLCQAICISLKQKRYLFVRDDYICLLLELYKTGNTATSHPTNLFKLSGNLVFSCCKVPYNNFSMIGDKVNVSIRRLAARSISTS